jgi:hypothetical protein
MPKPDFEDKHKRASLERDRYEPRFDERISKLPVYLGKEIKLLKEIAEEEKWNLSSSSSSYSNNQEPPLYNSNTFFEYLDESLDPNIVSLLLESIDNMPLYINHEESWYRALSKWRLKLGL